LSRKGFRHLRSGTNENADCHRVPSNDMRRQELVQEMVQDF